MQIPIKIEAARRAEIKELTLFYSTDQGRTWSQGGAATPEQEAFTFTAPADGLYWFSLMLTRRDGTREPPTPNNLPPSMKVVIDTVKPVARFTTAERQGDEITLSWQVQEANPDWASFKLEYRAADSPTWMWTLIPARGNASGQTKFRPAGTGPVTIRLYVKDQAGNETTVQKDVAASTLASHTTAAGSIPSPAPLEPPPLVSTPPNTNSDPPVTSAASNPPATPPAPQPPRDVMPPPLPPSAPTPRDAGPPVVTPSDRGSPFEMASTPSRPIGSGRSPNLGGVERAPIPAPGGQPLGDAGYRVVAATTDPHTPQVPMPGTSNNTRSPAPPPTNLLLSNSVQVNLDYEVNKIGPSGVGSVELYITRDHGARWERYAEDPDLKPPMVVDLPGEGVYGLALVVRSKAGLGRPAPRNGDKPQMVIEVDTTAPEAQLYAPQPVKGQRDQLVISWEAKDKNLTANPVTLEWAERQGGPWQPIGADLPNTGRHTWKLPPNLPYNVFMRLIVRDAAGNVSVAETDRPVLVDLSEPEGVIKTVQPVGSGNR
jgi:hypothetical protein